MSNYIQAMIFMLTDYLRAENIEYKKIKVTTWKLRILSFFSNILERHKIAIIQIHKSDYNTRLLGRDQPAHAESMIGYKRMVNVHDLCQNVIQNRIPGDFVETGCWRGGTCLLMGAILKENNVSDRSVFACDSFRGLPKPDSKYKWDAGDTFYKNPYLSADYDQLCEKLKILGMKDMVIPVVGWFKDTLPDLPAQEISILRLDGDMYQSTWEALTNLYHRVSTGGYIIIDDYILKGCQEAVGDFLEQNGIDATIIDIDGWGVYWKKES